MKVLPQSTSSRGARLPLREVTQTDASSVGHKLRIGLVAPSLDILGGQGVQAKSLEQALKQDGFDVVFVPINPRFPARLQWIRRIPVLRTVLNQLLYLPGLGALRTVDVVHVFSASYWSFLIAQVPAIIAGRLFGKRVVLNYHSGEADDHLSHWGLRVHPWLRKVDEIVVPSDYLKDVFGRHGYSARVIRNIVNTAHFRYRERRPLRPRLLSVRNLESLYCVENTLKAYAILKRNWPHAQLVIAGYGSQEDALRHWVEANHLKDVTFVGRTEPQDMPALYDSSDIFLNSSVIDNQPVSVLEAFAAGIHVISTPTGDIPAMVRDGETGSIVPHNDPQAMADEIVRLLGTPVEAGQMARRAREEVNRYTWPSVRQEWNNLFMPNKT